MQLFKRITISLLAVCAVPLSIRSADVVDYVNPLVGSESKYTLSTGNTYPVVAMPWGMNFWTPQTGKMGDGWTSPAQSLDQRLWPVLHHAGDGSSRVQ